MRAGIKLSCLAALAALLAPPAQAQVPRERETIQVGLIDRTFFPQPVMVAIQNGYFADEELRGATVGILTLTEGSFFNWQDIARKHGLDYPGDYKVMQTAGAGARHH